VYYIFGGMPRNYFNLRKVLASSNGHTKYFLHVCRHSWTDYRRATYMSDLPNMALLCYPCDQHIVVRYIAKLKFLDKIFDIRNQDELNKQIESEIEQYARRA
jgi:hypothetical protein